MLTPSHHRLCPLVTKVVAVMVLTLAGYCVESLARKSLSSIQNYLTLKLRFNKLLRDLAGRYSCHLISRPIGLHGLLSV